MPNILAYVRDRDPEMLAHEFAALQMVLLVAIVAQIHVVSFTVDGCRIVVANVAEQGLA